MKGAVVRFARALRRRCPNCGGGPVIVRGIRTVPACPGCRLRLDRGEPDYFLGAIVCNMAFAEGVFAAGLLGVLLWTYPNPPWDAIYYGGIVGLILVPILFYPYSKLLWLAFDLLFRPLRPEDFDPPAASDETDSA
ncbi:MAG: hypothetical protein ACREKJ_10075 [Candidatus Rokuibacteriota bacterium]